MKKTYEAAKAELILLNTADVIVTSSQDRDPGEDGHF